MPANASTLDDDLIDAIREDEIESLVAEAREFQQTRDSYDSSPPA